MSNDEIKEVCYWIDLAWCEKNGRSFKALIKSRLCLICQTKTVPEKDNHSILSNTVLIDTIKDCCSKWEGFITPQMSIIETTFRIFLSNGNQPLTASQIELQIREIRGDDYSPDSELLEYLLTHDTYYGLRATSPADN